MRKNIKLSPVEQLIQKTDPIYEIDEDIREQAARDLITTYIMVENSISMSEQTMVAQALMKQTSDSNNEVKRNAFTNLANCCDQLVASNTEMLVTNLAQMVEVDNENSEGATQCLCNLLRKEGMKNYDLILEKILDFTNRNLLNFKTTNQFILWLDVFYVLVKSHATYLKNHLTIEEKSALVTKLMTQLTKEMKSHIYDYICDSIIMFCGALSKSVQSKMLKDIFTSVKNDSNSFFYIKLLGRLILTVSVYDHKTIKEALVLILDKATKISKKNLDEDINYPFEVITFLTACVVKLDTWTLFGDDKMRKSLMKVVNELSGFNPNYNEDAENDMKDVEDDEDDGWGEADEYDEYENKQFDNIEDDSFKIRIAVVKLLKEIIGKICPINKDIIKYGSEMADKLVERCGDNVGEVQAVAFECLEVLTKCSSRRIINWDMVSYYISQLCGKKDAGKKEISKGLDLVSQILQKSLITKATDLENQQLINLFKQTSQNEETKYQVLYNIYTYYLMYTEEAAKLMRTNQEFITDIAIADINQSVLRNRKIGLMLLREVLNDTEGVQQNSSVASKALKTLALLLKILKEESNELRILSIKVLEKIVHIKSLTDIQFSSICESLIETSDKSYASDGLIALRYVIGVKCSANLTSLKKKCWDNYSHAFLKTGVFSLKNLIAELVIFVCRSKNSLYDAAMIKSVFHSAEKTDVNWLLINLINNAGDPKNYPKLIIESIGITQNKEKYNPDFDYAIYTLAVSCESCKDIMTSLKGSKMSLEYLATALGDGLRLATCRNDVIKEGVEELVHAAKVANHTMFENFVYLLEVATAKTKMTLGKNDSPALMTKLLDIDFAFFAKEEYVKLKFFSIIGHLLSNDNSLPSYNLCHEKAKAYYPHILSGCLQNLIEMQKSKQDKSSAQELRKDSKKNTSGFLRTSSLSVDMDDTKLEKLAAFDTVYTQLMQSTFLQLPEYGIKEIHSHGTALFYLQSFMDSSKRTKMYTELKAAKSATFSAVKYIVYQKTSSNLNSGIFDFISDDINSKKSRMFDDEFIAGKVDKRSYINFLVSVCEFNNTILRTRHYFDFDMANGSNILNHVMDLNKVNDKLINTIDFGSFKKSEDEGLEVRQLAYETLRHQMKHQNEFMFQNHSNIANALLAGMDDVSETLSELKKEQFIAFIYNYYFELKEAKFDFKKFVEDKNGAIYRKFRIAKPTEDIMMATLEVYAILNAMYKVEFDSTVDNFEFDWTTFTSGLSKKDNSKWLDDNWKEPYLEYCKNVGKSNWSLKIGDKSYTIKGI